MQEGRQTSREGQPIILCNLSFFATWLNLMNTEPNLSLEETPNLAIKIFNYRPTGRDKMLSASMYDSSTRPSMPLNCGIFCSAKFMF